MHTLPHEIIKNLESNNSRLAKESILTLAMNENVDTFFSGLKMCLDPLFTFGIKQVPESTVNGQGLAWNVFEDLANKLNNRELTGYAARDAIKLCMDVATTVEWNMWYRRILTKDLKCGVSVKTVNKVTKTYPKYSIPVFSCQLAHDGANHEKKLSGNKLIEVKLDGVRVITVVRTNGIVTMYSRNGKELQNFPRIAKWFKNHISSQLTEDTVFDGEVMSSTFQDLMKQVHRKTNVQTNDAVLYLFDVISLKDFKNGKSLVPQKDRSTNLSRLSKLFNDEIIRIVGNEEVDLDTPNGSDRFKEINQSAIELGYEGIMVKDPDAPYECKRTHSWLKIKPFIEVTLNVISVEEGTGKNIGRLGALVCEGIDSGKIIKVNVGSGFTDEQRNDIWNTNVIGHMVEVRADAITQNQDSTYSLRFPRFKTFRGFEIGEKI